MKERKKTNIGKTPIIFFVAIESEANNINSTIINTNARFKRI